jgi:hypothetical protein
MDQDDRSSFSVPRRITPRYPRRNVLVSLAGGGLAIAAAGSRLPARSAPFFQADALPAAHQADGTPAPFSSQVFAGEGFVGEAENVPVGEAFVAVVVADAKPGAEAREARVLIYGDTENDIQEWFPGAVTGNRLDLVSEGGARLEGEFSAEGATGTITLADGLILPFDAEPATGVAGLYTVTFFPDGHFEGMSERGVRLEGQLGPEGIIFPMSGTLIPPEGDPQEFQVASRTVPATTSFSARFIILSDGRMHGGSKKKEGGNFWCPMID